MGQRKKPYTPKAFESTGVSNDTSANIYGSMLDSPAFKDLSKNQRLLYVYMKKQYYGTRKPGRDFPDMDQLQEDELFYFNLALAERYGLYSRSNDRQFYKDIAAIEQHGFIKTISNGRTTKSRSIYKFTRDWKQWKDSS
ncbi:hypothetical protein LJC58_01620 [Lachnospiraceae bacterium OttesenSCG-928-D06]|nr:hypothetical protein [Lachnospiraceae bacterium OttesenSCG-928-D06]